MSQSTESTHNVGEKRAESELVQSWCIEYKMHVDATTRLIDCVAFMNHFITPSHRRRIFRYQNVVASAFIRGSSGGTAA